MKFSRRWIYWATIVPVLGVAGMVFWKPSQPQPVKAANSTAATKASQATDVVSEADASAAPMGVSTKPGSPVNRVEHMTCEVAQGWPVVLVRDANDQSPWWIQGRAERQAGQRFTARAHFGNDATEPGQRYQIVVLSAKDESAAKQFETGATLEEIPAELPHSEPIEVVRR